MDAKAQQLVAGIRQNYDALFVLGIGGSYAGAKAAIDFLPTDFPVEFIGSGFETPELDRLWKQYHDQRLKLCVISKSGKTFEIMANLEYLEAKFRDKYGADFAKHLVIITGATGTLHDYATKNDITTLLHPDVGGRYSVLTLVGLFPMAVAGIDTDALLTAATNTQQKDQKTIKAYAADRYQAYQDGKRLEVFAVSAAKALQLANWYQQLFAESEGKNGKGMWTAPQVYSRDLHSVGQFIQQGSPLITETIIDVDDPANQMQELNHTCVAAVAAAHREAGVPVQVFTLPRTAAGLGRLFGLFLAACPIYCELLGVNPFDQPGVENYKSEMRRLLAK